MSVESGFHYGVCFQDAYAANCAFNYCSGNRFFGFEIFPVNEVISNHTQNVFEGLRKTIHQEMLEIGEVLWKTNELAQEETGEFTSSSELIQQEAVAQIEVDDVPITTAKNMEFTAYQVLDEISEFMVKGTEMLEVFPKEIVLPESEASQNKGQVALSFDAGGECLKVANYGLFDEVPKMNEEQQPEFIDHLLVMVGVMEGCVESTTYGSKVLRLTKEVPKIADDWSRNETSISSQRVDRLQFNQEEKELIMKLVLLYIATSLLKQYKRIGIVVFDPGGVATVALVNLMDDYFGAPLFDPGGRSLAILLQKAWVLYMVVRASSRKSIIRHHRRNARLLQVVRMMQTNQVHSLPLLRSVEVVEPQSEIFKVEFELPDELSSSSTFIISGNTSYMRFISSLDKSFEPEMMPEKATYGLSTKASKVVENQDYEAQLE